MLNVLNYIKRPEYVFRPSQVLNRFRRIGKGLPPAATVNLPWGAPLKLRTDDAVGNEIFYYGIYDRIVPETIWRLMEPGETGVDIGANIGQNTSAMAFKSGPQGRVVAFEPHPETFSELKANVATWPAGRCAQIHLKNVALGEVEGEAILTPGDYRSGSSLKNKGQGIPVPVRQWKDFIGPAESIGICKIDVEGHEFSVLKGAAAALSRRAIRDIIFEDFATMPSPTAEYLRGHQFTVFQLCASWSKPNMTEIHPKMSLPKGFTYNYLATLDPERAKSRFQPRGWRCLTCRFP
jgi:FkbM family methyltransferase